MDGGLTPSQLEFFNTNGYLHIPGVISKEECALLRERAAVHVAAHEEDESPPSVFTTNDQVRKSDDKFLTSGNAIRCFFEESDVSKVNKLGHNLHNLDEAFRKVSYSQTVKDICKSLKYIEPAAVQSMYIFKHKSVGGQVRPHQDGVFLYTNPQSVTGFWWAMEKCDLTNGCLYIVPGSHRSVPISQHFRRKANGDGTEMVPENMQEPYNLDGAVPLLAEAGDMVLLHHSVVHYSAANTHAEKSRQAYAVHVIETKDTDYPKENWLQYPEGEKFQLIYKQ